MKKTLNIIGGGQVGKVLGQLFSAHGVFQIQDVMNRSSASSSATLDFIGAGRVAAGWQELRHADVTMLSVPDDQIAPVCAALAQHGHALPGTVVFHCSGALSSLVLQAATVQGAAVASLHPVRSFAQAGEVAQHFAGTICGLEGDPLAVQMLKQALAAIGAQTISLEAGSKTLYHAASVFACNYLVTLLDVALQAYVAAGISEDMARQLAEPLVRGTVDNIFKLGPAQALSGPIARGDWVTVDKQQRAVTEWDAAAGELYASLAQATKKLAQRKSAV